MAQKNESQPLRTQAGYACWLGHGRPPGGADAAFARYFSRIEVQEGLRVPAAVAELQNAARALFGVQAAADGAQGPCIRLRSAQTDGVGKNGFALTLEGQKSLTVTGADENGVLYGVFRLLADIRLGRRPEEVPAAETPRGELRLVQHWDNMSGDIERGYAGHSLFFKDGAFLPDLSRVQDYARLLASVGVNGVVLNNVNVFKTETRLITAPLLQDVARVAGIFAPYGIRVFLSVNFAAPIAVGGLPTADPLDAEVQAFWARTFDAIYRAVPQFGGVLVKADSESRPGPYAYGRDHAQGANLLARALAPHGGLCIWRCFVYDCQVDWRDRKTDRAKAAYENFAPLDGRFDENVVLQVKNGPMDFQIREPVTPLFGALPKTNTMMEVQITQEYTGQQRDLCYLAPLWKEALEFDTHARGAGSTAACVSDGSLFHAAHGGLAGVANVGDSPCWTGNPLAQANLYAFGRLAWDHTLSAETIAEEWAGLTFGAGSCAVCTAAELLMQSRAVYEHYTCPLGIGWFVNPGVHYGPSVDGYEYSRWGTYHYADWQGIGVDRTAATGTGYAAQYAPQVAAVYEHAETCPENLLLFFHHLPYTYRLRAGKTILQHIYDTHFEGVEEVRRMQAEWQKLKGEVDDGVFEEVCARFALQVQNAEEWRDVVNTYFYRKTGVPDAEGRNIYP